MIENSKEKKLGQIFTEKFPPIERNNQEPTESMKAIFPWLQESVTSQISTDTKHFDELITQKTRQAVNSIRTELAEHRLKLDRVASEKNQQKEIDSIKSELAEHKYNLAEYKSKIESALTKKSSQNDIELLQSELANYKSKLESSLSERIQQNDIDSIRTELAECKSKIDVMVNEITMFLEVINSINEEVARLKNNPK